MSNQAAQKKLPAFLVLTIICLIAALALAATNAITKDPIAAHEAAKRAEAFGQVLTATAYEELEIPDGCSVTSLAEAWNKGSDVDVLSGATVTSEAVIQAVNEAAASDALTATAKGFQSDVSVTLTKDENGVITALTIDSTGETQGFGTRCTEDETFAAQFVGKTAPFVTEEAFLGYCVVAEKQGYGGPVAVTLGISPEGVITGAVIGDGNFVETPGFGAKWQNEAKAAEFVDIDLAEGGVIEVISGATITSKAVLNAANNALEAVNVVLGNERTEPVLAFGVIERAPVLYADSVAAGDYTASAAGFQSNVTVTFTVGENSDITALTIDSTSETAGYGTRCTENADFAAQFIGKTIPVTMGEDVDALSGATVTSTAVVDAINSIALISDSAAEEETPAVEASTEIESETSAETLTASAKGLLSDVTVTITLNEDGTIATMAVDASGETPAIAGPCTEEAYLAQFIGKAGPFADADVVAGATFTSTAIIEALNSLFPAE